MKIFSKLQANFWFSDGAFGALARSFAVYISLKTFQFQNLLGFFSPPLAMHHHFFCFFLRSFCSWHWKRTASGFSFPKKIPLFPWTLLFEHWRRKRGGIFAWTSANSVSLRKWVIFIFFFSCHLAIFFLSYHLLPLLPSAPYLRKPWVFFSFIKHFFPSVFSFFCGKTLAPLHFYLFSCCRNFVRSILASNSALSTPVKKVTLPFG